MNPNEMTLVSNNRPAKAQVGKALKISSLGGTDSGGHLYTRILDPDNPDHGYDELYARFYIRFPSGHGSYHHTTFIIGGYNPSTLWPLGGAGLRPTGDDRVTIQYEPMQNMQMELYNYWMGMHDANGGYWGNTLISDPDNIAPLNQWICVEYRVKMNPTLSAPDGELALWQNDQLIHEYKQGTPLGFWVWGSFFPTPMIDPPYVNTPGTTPFEGLQWRSSADLNLNFINIQHYVTDDPDGFVNSVMFSSIVVAKQRVGCIQ
jgi:hypothetical protein